MSAGGDPRCDGLTGQLPALATRQSRASVLLRRRCVEIDGAWFRRRGGSAWGPRSPRRSRSRSAPLASADPAPPDSRRGRGRRSRRRRRRGHRRRSARRRAVDRRPRRTRWSTSRSPSASRGRSDALAALIVAASPSTSAPSTCRACCRACAPSPRRARRSPTTRKVAMRHAPDPMPKASWPGAASRSNRRGKARRGRTREGVRGARSLPGHGRRLDAPRRPRGRRSELVGRQRALRVGRVRRRVAPHARPTRRRRAGCRSISTSLRAARAARTSPRASRSPRRPRPWCCTSARRARCASSGTARTSPHKRSSTATCRSIAWPRASRASPAITWSP